MVEELRNFLKPEQIRRLEEVGKEVDKWRSLLNEVGGDEDAANLLVHLRDQNAETIILKGSISPRVAAQKMLLEGIISL